MYVMQPNQAFGCIFLRLQLRTQHYLFFCATKITFLSEMIYDFL